MSQQTKFIEVDRIGDVLVLEITAPALNDFDIAHAVADQIDATVRQSSLTRIVLNLRNVELLTSVGLVVFVRLRKTANDLKGCVALCCVQDNVAQVFTITRLAIEEPVDEGQFAIVSDVDAAIAAFDAV